MKQGKCEKKWKKKAEKKIEKKKLENTECMSSMSEPR